MKYSIKDWSKGLNYDSAEYELEPGFCSNALNVRFRNGFAERVGGIDQLVNASTIPLWMYGYRNSLASDGVYLVYGYTTNLYAYNWGTNPEVKLTRYEEGVTISSITSVGTTATLTTASNHGLSSNNYVSIWGALPSQYNGTYKITVTGVTTFTYTMASDPGASAAPVGLYSVNGATVGAVISSITRVGTTATLTTATPHGRSIGGRITVVGTTPSGFSGAYVIASTPTSTSFTYVMAADPGGSATVMGTYVAHNNHLDFTNAVVLGGRTQQYSGGSLNGVLFVNSPSDGLYYWNGDRTTALRKSPDSYKALVSRPYKNYIVQLAPTVSGTQYPQRVAWSNAAAPGSIPTTFTASSTNDAGDVELAETGGELIDCLPLGDQNIIYTQDARYAMQYVGGNEVFRFTRLPGNEGLLHRGCVADTPVGHVFINTNGQVMVHNGAEARDISTGRVSYLLEGRYTSFVTVHEAFREVWICVPLFGFIDFPGLVLIWNWETDAWGIKQFASNITVSSAANVVRGTASSASSTKLYLGCFTGAVIGIADEDADDLGNPFTSMIERTGMDFGDADVVKNLQRSRWNFDATAGNTFNVYHGSAMTADADPTYKAPVTYTLGTTDYVNSRAIGGRFLAVKVTWTSSVIADGRIRSCDLDATPGGKR